MKADQIPQFGVMQGVKVLSSGAGYAGPFAATLMGEQGADVISLEPPNRPENSRSDDLAWAVEHRNQRAMTLDIPSAEGREVFKRLIRWADILIESSKGGTFAKWGLTDEVLWSYNPKLVIVHVSGYGQAGVSEYVTRPGYDGIAQAFSGYMHWNGEDDGEPLRTKPYAADFVPPLHAAFIAVAALRRAEQTGVGESIDLAQFETMVRIQYSYLVNALNGGRVFTRTGNRESTMSVYGLFRCADGGHIVAMIAGRPMWAKALPLLGLSDDPDFAEVRVSFLPGTPQARKADAAVTELCSKHSALEVEKMFNAAGVSCSRVFSPEEMESDPHYQLRETLRLWTDPDTGKEIKVPNIVPPMAVNPTQIWRGGPAFNADTDDILDELGYSGTERKALYSAGACKQP